MSRQSGVLINIKLDRDRVFFDPRNDPLVFPCRRLHVAARAAPRRRAHHDQQALLLRGESARFRGGCVDPDGRLGVSRDRRCADAEQTDD